MINSLSIIYPIFNEENRLHDCFFDIKKFYKKNKIKRIQFIFVDDGSSDNSKKIIENFIKNKRNFFLISHKKNLGKGAALRSGVSKAKYEWILTLDADVSVKLSQLNIWVKKRLLNKNKILFGSRNLKESNVKFILIRKFVGLIFIFITHMLFNIKILDTQCGFKLYKKKIAKKIFSKLKENGFIHDIEIVLLAKNNNYIIKELPVTWSHKYNGKVNLISDSLKMLINLIKLKFRFNKMK